jgi:hypothetical protein
MKNKRKEWMSSKMHLKLLQNDFVFFEGYCNLNEESAIDKLQRLAKDT